jgi:GT2 family glycosyltransferase
VLNYRTPYDTVLAVRSLTGQSRQPDRLMVVDNASGDGSVEVFNRLLPDFEVIETERNLGFSAGCNVGIREALGRGADSVLLVNGDVMLGHRTLEQLEHALGAVDVGIVGPLLLNRYDPSRVDAAGLTMNRWTGRFRVCGAGRRRDRFRLALSPPLSAVMGAVMLIRRAVFDEVGLFDEAYFFSFEDLDLCWRARTAGWRSVCVEQAFAYHAGSLSIGPRSANRIYYATRNHLRCARRVAPVPWPFGLIRAKLIILLNLAHAVRSGWGGRAASLGAWGRAVWHDLCRRDGPAPR